MPVFRPKWLDKLDKKPDRMSKENCFLRNHYLIHAAALALCPDGDLKKMARHMDMSYWTLVGMTQPSRGIVTAEHAVLLERGVGKDILPKEYLRPDLF